MTISQILVDLDRLVTQWLDGQSNLLQMDSLLHLKTGTTYHLLYTLQLSNLDGRPQDGVTAEHVLNSLMYALVLKHHLSKNVR